MITVTPENVDRYGRFTVVTREIGEGGVISVHRLPLDPGSWGEAGAWVPTDVSDQNAVIRAFVSQIWTDEVIGAFQAAFPYAAPAAPSE